MFIHFPYEMESTWFSQPGPGLVFLRCTMRTKTRPETPGFEQIQSVVPVEIYDLHRCKDVASGYDQHSHGISMALIEIDALPTKNWWIFHGELLNNQMVVQEYVMFAPFCSTKPCYFMLIYFFGVFTWLLSTFVINLGVWWYNNI